MEQAIQYLLKFYKHSTELTWRSVCVMDRHATTRGSIPGGDGVKKLHGLCKGQLMGAPSLNDLVVDGTLNTNNQPNMVVGNRFDDQGSQLPTPVQ